MLGEEGVAGRGWLVCLDVVLRHPFRAASFSALFLQPSSGARKVFLRHRTRSLTHNKYTCTHPLFCATKYHLSAVALRR